MDDFMDSLDIAYAEGFQQGRIDREFNPETIPKYGKDTGEYTLWAAGYDTAIYEIELSKRGKL